MDSLFTIQLEERDKDTELVKNLQKYFPEFPAIELDNFYSYNKTVKFKGEDRDIPDLFKEYITQVEKAIRIERASSPKTPGKLADLDKLYAELGDHVISSYKNVYVKTLIDVVRDSKNLEDGMTPIGFERFKKIIRPDEDKPASVFQVLTALGSKKLGAKTYEEYQPKENVDKFVNKDENIYTPTVQQTTFEATAKGADLTGIFANAAKALAMLLYKWETLAFAKGHFLHIDGTKYDGLRRTENTKWSRNIFHNIDTLINAAIDNVKEEILLHMNISSRNSNQFVAAMGSGVPLNDIVKIFAHPIIQELSELSTDKLLSQKIFIKELDKEVKLSDYAPNKMDTELSVEKITDSIFNGTPLEESQLHALLATYYTLTQVGEAIFTATMALSLLNGLPTDPIELSKLSTTWSKIIRFDNPTLAPSTPDSITRYEMANRSVSRSKDLTLRGSESLAVQPNDTWMFPSNTFVSGKDTVPHVRELFSAFVQSKAMVENLVWQARQEFDYVADRLFNDLGMWPVNKAQDVDTIKNEFWRFLTSNLKFKITGSSSVIDTRIGKPKDIEDLAILIKGDKVYVSPATKWTQDFEDKITALKEKGLDNYLLDSIQVAGAQGLILADKTEDPKYLAMIQEAFLELAKFKGPNESKTAAHSQLQLDLFKYVILKDGVSFTKTTMSYIFPKEFYSSYSRAAEARLSTILGHSYTASNFAAMDVIYDLFKYQYVRNSKYKFGSLSYTKELKEERNDSSGRPVGRTYKGSGPEYFADGNKTFKRASVVKDEHDNVLKTTYVLIPTTTTPYYEFDFEVLEKGFNYDSAIGANSEQPPLFYETLGIENVFKDKARLEVGDVVQIGYKSEAYPKKRQLAKVTHVAEKKSTVEKGTKKGRISVSYTYNYEVIGEISLEDSETIKFANEVAKSYSEFTHSASSMPVESLVEMTTRNNYLVMAVSAPNLELGLKADHQLYSKIGDPSFNVKQLIVYDINPEEAIENVNNFFDEIKNDTKTLLFDRDKLYNLTLALPLDSSVTHHILTKLKEERNYDTTEISEAAETDTLPDIPEC